MKLLDINPTELKLKIKYRLSDGSINTYTEILTRDNDNKWYISKNDNYYYVEELEAILDILKKLNSGEIKKVLTKTIKLEVKQK